MSSNIEFHPAMLDEFMDECIRLGQKDFLDAAIKAQDNGHDLRAIAGGLMLTAYLVCGGADDPDGAPSRFRDIAEMAIELAQSKSS